VVFRNEVLRYIYQKKKTLRKTVTSLKTYFPTVIYLFIDFCSQKGPNEGEN